MAQDGAYSPTSKENTPFISVWCAIDAVSAANGTLRVLPFDRNPVDDPANPVVWEAPPRPGTQPRPAFVHRTVGSDDANGINKGADLSGYFGPDEGDAIEAPAGSLVVFSSLLLHGSGSNTSDRPRRILNISYSPPARAFREDEAYQVQKAEPFLEGGEVVPEALRMRAAL